jgi:Golgi SNAP receptor complex protein 1
MRKQARQLENEIDLKLVSFSKLGTGHGGVGYKSDRLVLAEILSMFMEISCCFSLILIIINICYSFSSADTVPLLSGEHMFETMALEIEQLLTKVRNSAIHIRHRIIVSCTVLPYPCPF